MLNLDLESANILSCSNINSQELVPINSFNATCLLHDEAPIKTPNQMAIQEENNHNFKTQNNRPYSKEKIRLEKIHPSTNILERPRRAKYI